MTRVYKTEFREALREISQKIALFDSPCERVRIVEWIRRLTGISDDTIDDCKNRNDYVQLLKIMMRGGRLHGIFQRSVPDGDIPPLGEAMVNLFCDQCKDLPRAGPVEPFISRKTPDGNAYFAIRKIPDKGILCYLAVASDCLNLLENPEAKEKQKKDSI